MTNTFIHDALETAVQNYITLKEVGEPVTSAAFGVATRELQERLGTNLATAAILLKTELDRRGM